MDTLGPLSKSLHHFPLLLGPVEREPFTERHLILRTLTDVDHDGIPAGLDVQSKPTITEIGPVRITVALASNAGTGVALQRDISHPIASPSLSIASLCRSAPTWL